MNTHLPITPRSKVRPKHGPHEGSTMTSVPIAQQAGWRARWPRRPGALVVTVLICLGIAAMLAGSLIYAAVALRQAVQVDQWRWQADWLVQSALERAAAQLAADADYRGETWRLDAQWLESRYAARVEIAVESVPDDGRRRLRVAVYYPDDATHRVFRSKELIVAAPLGGPARKQAEESEN